MKRRDFLKQGGVAALGAPVAASLLTASSGCGTRGKDLVVSFTGPFCFWWNTVMRSITVMVPEVGLACTDAPHQPWFGTSQNEKRVDVPINTDLSLDLPGYKSPKSPKEYNQLAPFGYEQTSDKKGPALFNLTVPMPNKFIGIRPTSTRMKYVNKGSDDYRTKYITYASGLTFVYNKIDVKAVRIKQGSMDFFTPCFENDELLCSAGLGIHMTPLHTLDPGHEHANVVWRQMLAMYPWMQEITGIEFCPTFDPSSCKASCSSTEPDKRTDHPRIMAGAGNNCEVPNMCFPPFP